jgi:hypothetical protein
MCRWTRAEAGSWWTWAGTSGNAWRTVGETVPRKAVISVTLSEKVGFERVPGEAVAVAVGRREASGACCR